MKVINKLEGYGNMNSNFVRGLSNILKGVLLAVTLVVSTITVFFSDGMAYWNDMAFIVWCLCIIMTTEYFDRK